MIDAVIVISDTYSVHYRTMLIVVLYCSALDATRYRSSYDTLYSRDPPVLLLNYDVLP